LTGGGTKRHTGTIKANDRPRACALVHRHGLLDRSARSMFDLLLRNATSEDDALHAEKYDRSVTDEFATTGRQRTRLPRAWCERVALAD